jgi:uncharacterized protein (DUF885 family)
MLVCIRLLPGSKPVIILKEPTMKKIIQLCLITCGLLSPQLRADAGSEFQAVVDNHWQWYLDENPLMRTYLGDSSANDRWGDFSPQAYTRRYQKRAELLQVLAKVDVSGLDEQQQLTYTMLEKRLQEQRTRYELGLHLMDLTMREGPQFYHTTADIISFDAASDYHDWLSRMAAVPAMLGQYQALLELGIEQGRVQPRAVMERVPGQLERVLVAQADQNPYYKPFVDMPAAIADEQAQALRKQALQLVESDVTPAYRKFKQWFESSYLPAARPEPGVGSLEGGAQLYEFLAREFTTTNMSPEQIHETGKREVARILAEMEQVKASVGFDGNLQAFNDFLRTDPQFYYDTPEELLEAYQAVSKRIDPELVKLFGKLPRTPYGVKPIPDEVAPDTTTAYYMEPATNGTRAGYYYVNLYRPEVRPKYEMEVLSVHEAVPGHHLQIALGQEIEGLPEFRKMASITAFVEGWALYSERLGYQLGLYEDPYSRYGQLTYDMWRAVRLVVDTGIHYYGWSRQRAIDYFKANAGKTEADIINEIDRYIGWPGQALAYKIGQLKILELRERAETELGDRFDIRAFHDELLGGGAMPLDALEARIDAWIQRQ